MKIQRQYHHLDDVSAITKISNSDLIHMGVTGQLPIHALAANWLVDFFGIDVHVDSNGVESINYFQISKTPTRISGPVRLHKDSLVLLEADAKAKISKFVAMVPGDMDDDHDLYEYRLATDSTQANGKFEVELAGCSLVVLSHDLKALMATGSEDAEKPIHTKTLNGMNEVIAALAQKLNIDMNEPHSAADDIETYVSEIGGSVKKSTIAAYLKKIPSELKVIKKK